MKKLIGAIYILAAVAIDTWVIMAMILRTGFDWDIFA